MPPGTSLGGLGPVVAAGLCGGAIVAAAAPPPSVKRHEETVSVLPARTTTVNVAYPDALEFAGATYSGEVRVIRPNPDVGGTPPKLSLVTVLTKEPAEGGSVLHVRIRNANPRGTLAAQAEITRSPGAQTG
jgi:hypothetical protein